MTSFSRPAPLSPALAGSLPWCLGVGLAAALLCAPFFRTVYLGWDEGVLLHAADRMLQGQRLYADFFEFLPPGGFFLTAAWLDIMGVSITSARLLAVLTIVGIACATFLACRRVSGNAPLSALITLGWIAMSQGFWTQVSHHWFTTLFSMIAVWGAHSGVENPGHRFRWPLIVGAAAGMAAMVTPTRGALVMLAALTAFLDRRNPARLAIYLLACTFAPAVVVAYLLEQNTLSFAFDDVIRFTAERYASVQGVPFGYRAALQNFPLVYLFPVVALLAPSLYFRDRPASLRDRVLLTCVAFALASFIGCFPAPDTTHIAYAVPLACPLLACCMTRLTRSWHPVFQFAAAGAVIGLCAYSVFNFVQLSVQALRATAVPTPRGDVVFAEAPDAGLLARVVATPQQEAFFFYPHMSMLAFLAARQHVAKYDVFMRDYTLPSQYKDSCVSLAERASWVVIDRRMIDVTILKQMFPALPDAEPHETREFEQVLTDGFELISREGTYEIRRRREGLSGAACGGITVE